MKLDDLIKKLQNMRDCYGNTEVRLSMSGLGNVPINEYNFYTVLEYGQNGIKATTMVANPHWNDVAELISRLNKIQLTSIKEN